MNFFLANTGWSIVYVHRHDVEHPNPRRPARVLLSSGKENEWLIPLQSEPHRLLGRLVDRLTLEREHEEWMACEQPVAWVPGKIPIVRGAQPLQFEFIDPLESERRRRREASEAILSALINSDRASLLRQVARAEHADGLLGGHVLAVAALLALQSRAPDPQSREFGASEVLRARLREAAPSGTSSLQKIWASPGFERLKQEDSVRQTLTDAITQTFAQRETLVPGRWRNVRNVTLWNWWLRARLSAENVAGRDLAQTLQVDRREMEAVIRGETAPNEHFRAHLPSEEKVLNEFAEAAKQPPQAHAVASIAEAHRPRLTLMATQLAELERLLGKTERLSRWQDVRAGLQRIASTYSPVRSPGWPEWRRAQFAAQEVRALLAEGKQEAPLPLARLLDRTAASPLAMVFPFAQMLGELGLGPGAAPVIGLSPQMVQGDVGVLRFAIAHQLGHLLESLGGQPVFTCTVLATDDGLLSGESERFANAFAVYLLAPRDEMQQLAGTIPRATDWYWDAAQDVATNFGLSPVAAMYHLLNCVGEGHSKQKVDGMRRDSRWKEYRERVRDHVESIWSVDRQELGVRVGELPEDSVQEALRRPRSASFEQFISEASEQGMLEQDTVDDLRAA